MVAISPSSCRSLACADLASARKTNENTERIARNSCAFNGSNCGYPKLTKRGRRTRESGGSKTSIGCWRGLHQ